jgi:hypothetical protein
MALTMVISNFLFDYEPTIQLFFGIVIITLSLFMYFDLIGPLPPATSPEMKKEKEGSPRDIEAGATKQT